MVAISVQSMSHRKGRAEIHFPPQKGRTLLGGKLNSSTPSLLLSLALGEVVKELGVVAGAVAQDGSSAIWGHVLDQNEVGGGDVSERRWGRG